MIKMEILVVSEGRSEKISDPLNATDAESTVLIADKSSSMLRGYMTLTRDALRQIRRKDPDVLVGNYAGVVGLITVCLGLWFWVPSVIRLGGDQTRELRERKQSFARRRRFRQVLKYDFLRVITWLVYRHADGFLVVSEYLRQQVVSQVGCPPDNVVVVTQSVSDPLSSTHCQELDIDIDASHIVTTVTNFQFEGKYQGVRDSLAAMIPLLQRRPNLAYVVAGEGLYLDEIRTVVYELTDNPSVRSRIHFLGYVTDVEQLYLLTDVFLYISHIDAYPNVVREAQLARLPVVAAPNCGVDEQVRNGVNGFLSPADQSERIEKLVDHLLNNPSNRDRIGATARQQAIKETNPEMTGASMTAALSTIIT